MSKFLTLAEVEQWIDDIDGGVLVDVAATLRELAAIVAAVATEAKPEPIVTVVHNVPMTRCPVCMWLWHPGSPEEHNPKCVGIRARRLTGHAE